MRAGNAKTHGPRLAYKCSAVSIATEVCMLGKLFEGASKLCTKARNRSERPRRVLHARHSTGVAHGDSYTYGYGYGPHVSDVHPEAERPSRERV